MTKKIVFLSKNVDDASTRYRATQYIPYLEAAGYSIESLAVSGGVKAFIQSMAHVRQADIVIVLRKTFPSLQLKILRCLSKRLIFDFDDAIFCKSDGEASSTRLSRFESMASQADAICAGNNFLAEQARKFNSQVTVVPTSVESQRYATVSVSPDEEHIDLVWIGSSSTSKYLKQILPILDEAFASHPKLRLKVIADFELKDTVIPVKSVQWTDEGEIAELKKAHIGIAPMVDNTWTRGKCALKVLQYMAAGLPVITVNVGVNGEAVRHGETGLLVHDQASWLAAIDTLYDDGDLRKSMGQSGMSTVLAHYDKDMIAQRLLSVIEHVSKKSN